MQFRVAPALLLSVAAACSHPAPPAEPVPQPPEPAAQPVAAAEPASGESGPVLIDAGVEPRYQLRYRVPAGTLRTMTMTYDMTMALPGMPVTVTPTMLFTGSYDVLEVAADGRFSTRMTFDDTDVRERDGTDPATAAAMRSSLDKIEHLQILGTYDDRGMVLAQAVDAGTTDAATAQLVQQQSDSLKSAVTQLPIEAIGQGARWTATSHVINNGIRIDAETRFEALEVSATSMRLRTVLEMTAPRQAMTAAGTEGMTVEGHGTGSSELTIDLTTMVADIAAASDMAMTVGNDDITMEMSMQSQISLQIR